MAHHLDITDRLQRRMLEIVSTALPLIAKSMHDADIDGLAHLRGEMVEAMEGYCRHVHAVGGDRGDELIAGCGEIWAAYDAFRARWEHRRAAENWHEYRLSAVVMMKQVRTHVQEAKRVRTARLSA